MLQYRHDSLGDECIPTVQLHGRRPAVRPGMEGARNVDEATTASAVASSDSELAALLRTQPAAGIAALYDRYGRLVFSMALRIVQDRGAAEEITQDVFMRCWRNLDRYQPSQGSLVSWLLSIAHNRAIDELRSRRGKNLRREISDEELQPQAVI